MAYRTPVFNIWCQVYRYNPGLEKYRLYGYSLCQLRGPAAQWTGDNVPAGDVPFEVLFPVGSDLRTRELSPNEREDILIIAGMANRYIQVIGLCPKGGAFANEYTMAICKQFDPEASNPGGLIPSAFGFWRLNPNLVPPPGFTPLPLLTAAVAWSAVEA